MIHVAQVPSLSLQIPVFGKDRTHPDHVLVSETCTMIQDPKSSSRYHSVGFRSVVLVTVVSWPFFLAKTKKTPRIRLVLQFSSGASTLTVLCLLITTLTKVFPDFNRRVEAEQQVHLCSELPFVYLSVFWSANTVLAKASCTGTNLLNTMSCPEADTSSWRESLSSYVSRQMMCQSILVFKAI